MKRVAAPLNEQRKSDPIAVLEERFDSHPERHARITWPEALSRIEGNDEALRSLYLMEETEGEPDVIGMDVITGKAVLADCSPESPRGRRNLCYDRATLDSRAKNKPGGNAIDEARATGIELLDEDRYLRLQDLGEFDRKTSSWIETPGDVRSLGGALFGDRRYDTVFVYHNGAESYYGARGFRGVLYV